MNEMGFTQQKMIYDPYNGSVSEKLEIKKKVLVNDEKGDLKFLCHLLEKKLNDGSVVQFWKASAFFRLTRVSKSSQENKKFMQIHTDIVRSLYIAGISSIQIIANILKPNPEGLIFLYGVQATGNTLEEAKRKCAGDYQALLKSFQGTHRTAHIEPATKEQIRWVFQKIKEQKYISVVKGLPSTRKTSANDNSVLKLDTANEEQLEQFLLASESFEYVLMLMMTPINKNYLINWLDKSLSEESKWASQTQGTNSLGFNVGIPMTISMNNSSGTSSGVSSGVSKNEGVTEGFGGGHTEGTSSGSSYNFGTNEGTNSSTNTNQSQGSNSGWSSQDGTNEGTTASGSLQLGLLKGLTASGSYGKNWGSSHSDGTSGGSNSSYGTGSSQGTSSGTSESFGSNESVNSSDSSNWSFSSNKGSGYNVGQNTGTNQSISNGLATGLSIGANISKSYQWVDMEAKYIAELLAFQNQRLKSMVDGDGGFFVDMYLSTDSEENSRSFDASIANAWQNPEAKIDILRTEHPTPVEQAKLTKHMLAFSPCLEIQYNESKTGYYYKFSSILRSSELSSYNHPPRVSVGGLDAAMEDLPSLRVPTNRQNKEIYIGHVASGERYSYQMAVDTGFGYSTPYKFGIAQSEMHHAVIAAGSRSGKSVLASRMVLEMYNNTYNIDPYTGEKKRKRVLVLDPKGEWRQMGSLIERGKFKFYSVGKQKFHPLRMNLLRTPKYVSPYNYYNLVVEHFCSAYGLLDRAVAQISGVIYDLYEKNDVFGHEEDPLWAWEHSKDITLADVYDGIKKKLGEAEAKRNNHDAEALQTYLTRLDFYNKKHSNEYIMFCNKGGDSADSLLGSDEFTVIESNGLSQASQRFFFILLMNSIYENALARGPKGFYTDSYETVIVLEEANSVLIAAGNDDTSGIKSVERFNQLLDKSASLGLFFWTITQKIASMPSSVVANSGLIFVGRMGDKPDIEKAIIALGYDTSIKDLDVKKFIPRLTQGVFLVKITKGFKFEDQTPVCVYVAMLHSTIPDDKELEILIQEHELANLNLM